MELLWRNGQLVMQGSPSPKRPRDCDDPHPLLMADPIPPVVHHHDPIPHPLNNDYIPAPSPDYLSVHENEMATWLLPDFLPPPFASPPLPAPPPTPPTFVDSSDTPLVAVASDNAAECQVVRVGDSATRHLTVSSSSGASSASTEPIPPMKIQNAGPSQRKMTADDVGGDEVVHLLPKEGTRPCGSSSTKRSRAAEVHNLSERKRRDRINKKMRTLQELLPRSSKADKASMLDEAIEYLKSLQAQVQIMSMGCGTMPMFPFPGLQQYMPPMGMQMGMRLGMDMGLGMNQPTMRFPHMFPGLTPPTGGAEPLNFPRVCFPASQIPPHIPSPNPSRVPTPSQPDSIMLSLVSPQNQPRMQGFLDPCQQFLGLQHAHSSSSVATTINAEKTLRKRHLI